MSVLCLVFVIPNITGSLRLCIKPGPPACQSDVLTTTLPAPRVVKISTGLHHYLDTIPRTDERVIAINNGLKRSNDLALVSRGISIKCVLCDLYYVSYIIAERLAGGCPCILVP